MTEMPDNILHLSEYQVLGCKSTDDEMHFQVDAPDPIACEECGVQSEFVRFGKRDVPYRDLPIHGDLDRRIPATASRLRFQEEGNRMPRRSILSAAERDSLLALPDTQDELIRHYTFSEPDLSLICQRHGDGNRLSVAVQLCLLRLDPACWPQYAKQENIKKRNFFSQGTAVDVANSINSFLI